MLDQVIQGVGQITPPILHLHPPRLSRVWVKLHPQPYTYSPPRLSRVWVKLHPQPYTYTPPGYLGCGSNYTPNPTPNPPQVDNAGTMGRWGWCAVPSTTPNPHQAYTLTRLSPNP